MDAVIAVKVSRTGVVLSWLFGQMAVCVLITDWVLDTVNTIKEETSFICSASPTHRHAHKEETLIHTQTHIPNTDENCLPMPQRGTSKQTQKRTFIHTTGHKQSPAQRQLSMCARSYQKCTKQMNSHAWHKCWRTTKSHGRSPVISPAKLNFHPFKKKHH